LKNKVEANPISSGVDEAISEMVLKSAYSFSTVFGPIPGTSSKADFAKFCDLLSR
jgi:hypothetical protein